jgi:hypothetical protein
MWLIRQLSEARNRGAWDTKILGDVFADDVHGDFMEAYDGGKDLKLIRQELEQANAKTIADTDDGPIFWLALAHSQWECGALESDVRLKVEEIVQRGLGLERWAEGTAPHLHARQLVLRDFLTCIQTPPTSVRRRTPRKTNPPIFAPGVCLSVQLSNGEFGAAVVLGAKHERKEFGMNLVGILSYRSKDKPVLSVFKSRKWLKTKRSGRFRRKELIWLFAQGFADSAKLFEDVGTVKLRWFDPRNSKISAPRWSIVSVIIQLAFAKTD